MELGLNAILKARPTGGTTASAALRVPTKGRRQRVREKKNGVKDLPAWEKPVGIGGRKKRKGVFSKETAIRNFFETGKMGAKLIKKRETGGPKGGKLSGGRVGKENL